MWQGIKRRLFCTPWRSKQAKGMSNGETSQPACPLNAWTKSQEQGLHFALSWMLCHRRRDGV